MSINSHLSTCVGTQSPKYLEMTQGHIYLSHAHSQVTESRRLRERGGGGFQSGRGVRRRCWEHELGRQTLEVAAVVAGVGARYVGEGTDTTEAGRDPRRGRDLWVRLAGARCLCSGRGEICGWGWQAGRRTRAEGGIAGSGGGGGGKVWTPSLPS
jgi:hypothetical protein